MKPIVAGLVTVLILTAMLVMGSRNGARVVEPEPEPRAADARPEVGASPAEETVQALLRSGEGGDVTGYLASFTGPLKTRIERELETRGRTEFAADLKRSAAARKSHAVFAAEPDGDTAARVAVETVYPDRNERQTYRVEKTDDGWRIADVATVRSHQPTAKFGSPASYVAPEGVPVQTTGGLSVETGDDADVP